MIYRIFIGVFALIYVIYIFLCLLEVLRIIKFTSAQTTIRFPQILIPLYYFFKD